MRTSKKKRLVVVALGTLAAVILYFMLILLASPFITDTRCRLAGWAARKLVFTTK